MKTNTIPPEILAAELKRLEAEIPGLRTRSRALLLRQIETMAQRNTKMTANVAVMKKRQAAACDDMDKFLDELLADVTPTPRSLPDPDAEYAAAMAEQAANDAEDQALDAEYNAVMAQWDTAEARIKKLKSLLAPRRYPRKKSVTAG